MRAKLINEGEINDLLKPKSKEEIISSLEHASKEDKISFILQSNPEKFFEAFDKSMVKKEQIQLLLNTIYKCCPFTVYYENLIESLTDLINRSNNENWKKTEQQILNMMNDYQIDGIIEELL